MSSFTSPSSFASHSRLPSQALAMSPSSCSSRRSSFSQFPTIADGYSSSSASDYASSSFSFPPFSSCPSPSSSLASSPALKPSPSCASGQQSPLIEPLSLDDSARQPTARDVSAYAATVIRNEAYALLALASRIAPSGMKVVSEPEEMRAYRQRPSSADGQNRAIDDDEPDSEASSADEHHHLDGSATEEESRTNVAFSQAVRNLSALPAHGKILVTGVGKSGIAACKMVATFTSLGTPPPARSSPSLYPYPDFLSLRVSQASRPCSCTRSRPSTATWA